MMAVKNGYESIFQSFGTLNDYLQRNSPGVSEVGSRSPDHQKLRGEVHHQQTGAASREIRTLPHLAVPVHLVRAQTDNEANRRVEFADRVHVVGVVVQTGQSAVR